MSKGLPGRSIVILLVASMALVWLTTQWSQVSHTETFTDYQGSDAVVHAHGSVSLLSGGSPDQFDIWYDKQGQRFSAETPDGLLLIYQNGVLQQLPGGAATRQRAEQVIGFDIAAARYLRYFQWAVDPSLHAGQTSLETEEIDGVLSDKKLMPDSGYIWVGLDGRLLRYEPLDMITMTVRFSYDELRRVNPAEMPVTVFAAGTVATMAPDESSYRSESYKSDDPNDLARMYAMTEYNTYWVGLTYHDFAFDDGVRNVTVGAAVELSAFGTGQVVDRKDVFEVNYLSTAYPGVDRAFLRITSTPLTAFHNTIDMAAKASPAAVPGGSDAWTMGGETAGESRSLTFSKDDVQVYLRTNTSISLFQVAADLRLIREDAP
ncbi:MAG: hypothetical protein IPJ58_19180 [Ardenticatenia bacterium]|nr:hypothetical protein [Ardenticatenia bacterium]